MPGHIGVDVSTVAKPTKDVVSSHMTLTPYRRHHVPTYHSWMISEELRHFTASEPLTLEEEYEMRDKWEKDPEKLTFIILDNSLLTSHAETNNTSTFPDTSVDTSTDTSTTQDKHQQVEHPHIKAMIGDVNLFFHDYIDGAELEVMIAVASARRHGYAQDAIECMMTYAQQHYHVTRFVVKILCDNIPSIRLFVNKLGFIPIEYVEVFNELELETCPASDIDLNDPEIIEQRAIACRKTDELLHSSDQSLTPVTITSSSKDIDASTTTTCTQPVVSALSSISLANPT